MWVNLLIMADCTISVRYQEMSTTITRPKSNQQHQAETRHVARSLPPPRARTSPTTNPLDQDSPTPKPTSIPASQLSRRLICEK